jgi:2-polyprenyl-6-methoxyphenol hydroxylase-like FAD-dependent oxidoreductase
VARSYSQILAAVSGYPVRPKITRIRIIRKEADALIGDAAHPMSPFKGRANQALLDALSLARAITKECRPLSKWRELECECTD